jgi:hypothetical protein
MTSNATLVPLLFTTGKQRLSQLMFSRDIRERYPPYTPSIRREIQGYMASFFQRKGRIMKSEDKRGGKMGETKRAPPYSACPSGKRRMKSQDFDRRRKRKKTKGSSLQTYTGFLEKSTPAVRGERKAGGAIAGSSKVPNGNRGKVKPNKSDFQVATITLELHSPGTAKLLESPVNQVYLKKIIFQLRTERSCNGKHV